MKDRNKITHLSIFKSFLLVHESSFSQKIYRQDILSFYFKFQSFCPGNCSLYFYFRIAHFLTYFLQRESTAEMKSSRLMSVITTWEKDLHMSRRKLSELMTECGTISISWRETSIVVGEKSFFFATCCAKSD